MNTFENLKKCHQIMFCYWLSVYDIIKSIDMEMMINSPQIMVVWSVSVQNLKSFRGKNPDLWAERFGEVSIMFYGEMSW